MKIKRIQINNYRAFLVKGDNEIGRYIVDLPNGENLLIYGENGSGKSSLFKALKDFFISALNTGMPFQKNLFYEEGQNFESPFIDVVIDDDSHHRFSADGNQYVLLENKRGSNTNYISQANVTNGFISYRDLLRLHYRENDQEPDLFSLFFGEEGLFSDMTIPAPAKVENKLSFRDLWKKCTASADQDAIADFNTNISALFEELEKKANVLLALFQKECKLSIDYTGAKGEKKNLLSVINPPAISFKVTLYEKEIPKHDDMLNEARLTALAISVFLAHQLCLPPTDLRILFLDDIFIGLDMSNRIPLIKILTASDLGDGTSFKGFQIFLTTYDRDWFHVAKTYLGTGWQKAEFYVDDHSYKVERPLMRKSDTYRERAEGHLAKGDYPASANYLRKAFEKELRRILPENTLYPGFNGASGDNSIIALSKRSLTFSENDNLWFYKLKEEEDTEVETFRFTTLQQMIDQFKKLINQYSIPFRHIEELIAIKNRLLNPLSHDDTKSSIFKAELITGFEIFDELQKIISKVVLSIDDSNAIQMYSIRRDYKNQIYYYRFELRENLTYIQYNGFRTFLNASFYSQYRTKEYKNFEVHEKEYTSLRKLCEGIFFLSAPLGAASGYYENFMFDEIYTTEDKKLSELIR